MSWPVVGGVCVAWILIGVVLGSQTALGMTMQGNPVALSGAVQTALVNNLPWIPPTLMAIWIAIRVPVTKSTWKRAVWVHIVAVPMAGWVANVGVVSGFWILGGTYNGLFALARQAAFWATVRLHVALLVYGVTVTLTWGWLYLREARARELRFARLETQLTRARLQALNEQMRPHFLFNTLHTIGQLWRSGRAVEADEMLDHLGSLFQRVRASTDHPTIPLDDELSMVEAYLAIERSRFSDRLTVEVTATPEARSCAIPPLLLQPLVENAIRHGVSTSPTAGRVRVRAEVRTGRLVLTVEDDGPGMNGNPPRPGGGTGLPNTRERLRYAFGEDHSFDITSPEAGGTTIRVELPATTEYEPFAEGAK